MKNLILSDRRTEIEYLLAFYIRVVSRNIKAFQGLDENDRISISSFAEDKCTKELRE